MVVLLSLTYLAIKGCFRRDPLLFSPFGLSHLFTLVMCVQLLDSVVIGLIFLFFLLPAMLVMLWTS